MLLQLLVLISILLVWLYAKWSRVKRYWADRGVPHDSPHPVFGSLTFLLKLNPAIWMRETYDRFKSPYIGVWLFWRPALIVNSPEIARRILVKDSYIFRNRLVGTGTSKVDPIGGQSIFTLNDPMWTSIRRRLSPLFTSSKLKSLHNLFLSKSEELAQRIENDLKKNKVIELRSLYADYTTDIIGISAFGVNCEAMLTGESALRSVTKEFMKFSMMRGLAWCSIFFLPEVAEIFRFNFLPKSAVQYFRKVFKQMVAERGGYNGKAEKNDLLDALRRIKYEAEQNNEEMDEDVVIAQAAVFLQAGFNTSASALTFLTYELAYKPDIQDKLYKELLQAKQSLNGKEFDASVLGDLVYLNCVFKETIRKYPPMGWLDRVADRDYTIDENLTISKGTPVYVNAVGMHHDPEYFPDPDKFDPDRFLPENDDGSRPFMPFGEGPRICIGTRFAYRAIWFAVAAVLLKFEIRPIPGTKPPVRCEVDHRGLILTPGAQTLVQFVPRP